MRERVSAYNMTLVAEQLLPRYRSPGSHLPVRFQIPHVVVWRITQPPVRVGM